jgi:HlyD family secretion protein
MPVRLAALASSLVAASLGLAQTSEPAISKDNISVHEVRRGAMPLDEMAAGVISATDPPRAVVTVSRKNEDGLRPGAPASIQIKPPNVIRGKIGRITNSDSGDAIKAEIELADALPEGVSSGTPVHALIRTGELRDVVFFGRPADSRPNSEGTVFVIEPDGQHARRVKVHYGRQSGPLVQILDGLSAGDHVIVTDMSAWAGHARVRLE